MKDKRRKSRVEMSLIGCMKDKKGGIKGRNVFDRVHEGQKG